jgi:hypothetical protein
VGQPHLREILGDAEMNDFSPLMVKHNQGIQDPKRRGRDLNISIGTVSVSWLCRKLRQVGEGVLGRRGGYLPTAELKHFAMDSRWAPERVGSAHPADQVADFGIRLGSSGTA